MGKINITLEDIQQADKQHTMEVEERARKWKEKYDQILEELFQQLNEQLPSYLEQVRKVGLNSLKFNGYKVAELSIVTDGFEAIDFLEDLDHELKPIGLVAEKKTKNKINIYVISE